MSLSPEQRQELVRLLEKGKELSPEWKAEVQRQCREVDENLVALRDTESVFKTAFASLG